MREIKFRGWDVEEGMIKQPIFAVQKDGTFQSPHVLMQFTGLKDKNGKEIYEGDLLMFDGSQGEHEVKYDLGMFRAGLMKYGPDFIRGMVCGNIYENLDLLKP